MDDKIKISELTKIQSLSDDDEFVVVDKDKNTGTSASESGQTSRATLSQIKEAVASQTQPSVGEKGQTGEQGPQGIQGDKGETGSQGIPGQKGDTGNTGADGNVGLQGEQGIAGDKGDIGENGIKGEQGSQGITGNDGEKGQKGEVGEQGTEGIQGIKGERGISGLTGASGEKGQTGLSAYEFYVATTSDDPTLTESEWIQSLNGTTGDKGSKGEVGSAGADGVDGTQGLKGIKGEVGSDGESTEFNYKGEFVLEEAHLYKKNDMVSVSHLGSSYVAKQDLTLEDGMHKYPNDASLTDFWQLVGIGIQGTNGEKGAKGATGATGDTGSKGEVGTSGSDGESVTWLGSYDYTALYAKNSIVVLEMNATITAADSAHVQENAGNLYISTQITSGKLPGVDSDWQLVMEKPDDGESLVWMSSYSITGPWKKNEIYILEETAEMASMASPPPSSVYGNIYICLEDHDVHEWPFQSSKWMVFIPVAPQGQKGEKGATGNTGNQGSSGTSFQWQGDYDASPGVGGVSRYSQYDVVRINANHSSLVGSTMSVDAEAVDGNLYIVNAATSDGSEYPWSSPNSTWQLFLEAPSGSSGADNNTSINWKGDYDASMDVGGVFRYSQYDLVRINSSHPSITAVLGPSAIATEGNLYMVTANFADGVEQPWDSPNGTWILFAEAPLSTTYIQNPSFWSQYDDSGTHGIGGDSASEIKFEMWYTETNNKVSLKGRFNFGQATQFSSPAQINLNPGYRTIFPLNTEFPDGKKLPPADSKSTNTNSDYKYLGKAYSLNWDFGSEVWEQKDFTCIVSSMDGLVITNTTNQVITLTGDFYFEIEYDISNI